MMLLLWEKAWQKSKALLQHYIIYVHFWVETQTQSRCGPWWKWVELLPGVSGLAGNGPSVNSSYKESGEVWEENTGEGARVLVSSATVAVPVPVQGGISSSRLCWWQEAAPRSRWKLLITASGEKALSQELQLSKTDTVRLLWVT